MRCANVVALGSVALIVGLVACGGRAAKGPDSPAAAAPTGANGEKLTSKPPPPAAPGPAADKSPKTVCAGAKAIATSGDEATPAPANANRTRGMFAIDKDRELFSGERKAKGKEYSMADLKALEAKKEWRELVMHLDDVPPAKRDAAWDALVEKAAPEFMGQTVKEKDPFEGFYMASHLVDKYPKLTKNKAFMEKRLEVSKTAFSNCFSQSYRGDRCLKAAQEFVNTGEGNADSAFAIAKVVRLGQNAHVSIPFFEKGLDGRKAGAAECGDEDLKLSVLSALALPPDYDGAKIARKLAAGVCFDKLKPSIEGEFKDGSSYYTDNACSVLKAKNAL
jgi:hypothetical protein